MGPNWVCLGRGVPRGTLGLGGAQALRCSTWNTRPNLRDWSTGPDRAIFTEAMGRNYLEAHLSYSGLSPARTPVPHALPLRYAIPPYLKLKDLSVTHTPSIPRSYLAYQFPEPRLQNHWIHQGYGPFYLTSCRILSSTSKSVDRSCDSCPSCPGRGWDSPCLARSDTTVPCNFELL